jgi:hypothetical protein
MQTFILCLQQVLKKAAESLAQVEERLDDCLTALNHYTGHILAHVSWTCSQSNPDVRVTGYKVLVDGKQYGTTLHAGVKNIRIKVMSYMLIYLLGKLSN